MVNVLQFEKGSLIAYRLSLIGPFDDADRFERLLA